MYPEIMQNLMFFTFLATNQDMKNHLWLNFKLCSHFCRQILLLEIETKQYYRGWENNINVLFIHLNTFSNK